jgi:hypothetical protein
MSDKIAWLCTFVLAVFLSLVLAWPVWAHDVETGHGIFCDTPAQLEEFIALGAKTEDVDTINAKEPKACALLSFAYVRGEDVSVIHLKMGALQITKILVIAWYDDKKWWDLKQPMVQYAMFPLDEEGA